MSFEGFPLIVGWELTLRCNLRCNHCGSSAGSPRLNELTTEEALKLCDQFPELLVQEVDLTGGEPLLRKDWAKIALHLRDLGIATNVLTNGLDLGLNTVSRMKDVGIACVGISLDGLEETHDRIRGFPGSFERVLKSIQMILKTDMPLNVITTVNSLNVHELPDIFQLLRSLGIEYWRVQPLIPIGRVKTSGELKIGEEVISELGNFILDWSHEAEKGSMQIIRSDGLEYIGESGAQERPWRGCPAGWSACGITSDGRVKGCLSMPDELYEGDLRKNDLWDIWFHPDSFSYTRSFSPDQLGQNCRSCDKAEDCRGGCSSSSYANTGIFHNDPYCFYRISKDQEPFVARKV